MFRPGKLVVNGSRFVVTPELAAKLSDGERRLYVYDYVNYMDGFIFNLMRRVLRGL
jgi:hypothetical protein